MKTINCLTYLDSILCKYTSFKLKTPHNKGKGSYVDNLFVDAPDSQKIGLNSIQGTEVRNILNSAHELINGAYQCNSMLIEYFII